MASNQPHDVTDTELAILHELWERGKATRRQITDALYPGGGARTTRLWDLLGRLERKGFVRHVRGENVLVFAPTLTGTN